MRNRIALLLIAPLAVVAASACEREGEPQPQQQAEAPQESGAGPDRSHAGKPMPDARLFDADNEPASLADASGEPVLVNLWASWCAPCVKELPTLQALSEREGAPRVVAVSQDIGPRPSVDAFLRSHGLEDLESWHDPEMELTSALKVQVMPTTVYYDSSGREVWRYVGDLDWTSEEAARLLKEGGGKG